jgi:fucose permease
VGVAVLFLTNGAVFATVVPRYPELKDRLDLSNTALGSAVAAFWLGALLVGLVAGAAVTRWTSARVAVACTLVAAANLVLVAAAPAWWALCLVLFVAGSVDSVADVAENAHALRVERRYGRSILNSLHGLWSIGAVGGGAAGAAAAGLAVPLGWHLSVAGALCALLALAAGRLLLPGRDETERPTAAAVAPGRRRFGALVLALGAVAAGAQLVEDVAATWSPVYLREDLGAGAAAAGLGFVALQASQTVGRLLGDRVVGRFGDRTVARAGALLAGAAVALALALPSVPATVVALGVAGLGIGTLIPAAMRAADAVPGLAPGVGLTLVGTVLRVAGLAIPVAVGFAADRVGLRVALVVVPVAAVAVLVCARALRRSD